MAAKATYIILILSFSFFNMQYIIQDFSSNILFCFVFVFLILFSETNFLQFYF